MKKTAPDGYCYDSPHFHAIARLVDRMVSGEIDRARVHMPPGHAKTETITHRLPTFIWKYIDPKARILITCHTQDYARDLGWAIREYALESGIVLRQDTKAKDSFRTDKGGVIRACGVGSTPTGRRFGWIIGDDPIKDRQQIESEVKRKTMDQWWTQGIMSRLLPKGRVFLIFTRWHEDDLGGRIEAREQLGGDHYETLLLKAIAEEADQIGRQPGEALWPSVYPLADLERRRVNMIDDEGLRGWEALYQQNPTPASGDIIDVSKLVLLDDFDWEQVIDDARAWDVGASPSGDPTAGVRIIRREERPQYIVVDREKFRRNSGDRDRRIRECAEADGDHTKIGLPQDPGAAGKSQVDAWIRMLSGFNVRVMPTSGSKETRVGPFASQVNAGNVGILRRPWTSDLVNEYRVFPGSHDDQVDASGDAFKLIAARRGVVGLDI